MSLILVLTSLIVGAFILFVAGDSLVDNAKSLGLKLKIDPMIIGLTVVSFGTSVPELFISAQGVLFGQSEIAIGNVVGSNITNVLLILGLSAALSPIKISKRTINKDIPVMIGVSMLFLLLSLDLVVSRLDGLVMFGLLIFLTRYEINSVKKSKREEVQIATEDVLESNGFQKELLYIFASLVALLIGSKLLIFGATEIARAFGISELVIGLTIVSIGTSLPEVVTSCVAARKGESELAIGNVVGSNILNVLGVMGICSMLKSVPVPLAALSFDIPILLFSAAACLPIVITDRKITRGEGLLLLGLYVSYIIYLILVAKDHASTPVISELLLVFILPLAAYYLFNNKKSRRIYASIRKSRSESL